MNTPWLDYGIRQMACTSISGYQKFISPRKGFSCAYRLLYGGPSCSQYVKNAIAQKGLAEAIKASRQRFRACRAANQILRARIENSEAESEDEGESKKSKRKNFARQQNHLTDVSCEACQCACDPINCASIIPSELPSCELPHCGHCLSGLDCSALDCGPSLDCGILDCGSCSW